MAGTAARAVSPVEEKHPKGLYVLFATEIPGAQIHVTSQGLSHFFVSRRGPEPEREPGARERPGVGRPDRLRLRQVRHPPDLSVRQKRNGIRRITFEGSYNTTPSWSPKGDRIAFVSRIGGRHHVAVMKPDGSDMTVLTERGNNEEPSFSPDGRYLAYTSDRDGAKGIYLMRIDGGGQKRTTPRGVKATSPSWSPQ